MTSTNGLTLNAEQLHTVASKVLKDLSDTAVKPRFENFSEELKNLVNNPGDGEVQNRLASARDQLFKSLSDLKARKWPSAMQQIVKDLGGSVLVEE